MLYEPIARIAKSQGYTVACEYPAGIQTKGRGDKKRIDFRFTKSGEAVLVEVKWAKRKNAGIFGDLAKLKSTTATQKYLLVFGQAEVINNFVGDKASKLPPKRSSGKVVHWDSGKTHYAARWYREKRHI
jgi:hypothetical protein